MKARINKNGFLILTPEADIEKYALDKWFEENQKKKPIKLILDLGN